MWFVYFLRSLSNSKKTYVGITDDLPPRLVKHNQGGCKATARFRPWKIVTYMAVPTKKKALELEKYFKSGSGHAWVHKHLW